MLDFHDEKNHQCHHLVTDRQCRVLRIEKYHILVMTLAGLLLISLLCVGGGGGGAAK